MAKLLGFGTGIFIDAVFHQQFGQRMRKLRRIDQVVLRDMLIPVIFQHAGISDLRHLSAVKLVKRGVPVKGHGQFQSPVSPEVEEDDAVPVSHGAHRLSVLRDDKTRQILVDDIRRLLPEGFNGFPGGGKLPALSMYMQIPALADHLPVGLIPVHGDHHPAAARGNAPVKRIIIESGQGLLQLIHILKC